MRETAEGVSTSGARVGIGRDIFFTARTVALIELIGISSRNDDGHSFSLGLLEIRKKNLTKTKNIH